MNDVACVFCKDTGFDLMGLKNHLRMYCDGYDITPDIHDTKVLAENVVQVCSDEWYWIKDEVWKRMTLEEQLEWSARN